MRQLWRWLVLIVVALLALQLFFVVRIALMAVVDPQSTAFQRSEAWRLALHGPAKAPSSKAGKAPAAASAWQWRQRWVDYGQIADTLKRAVIASEDAGFPEHDGVDWEALEKAWDKNEKALARAERQTQAAGKPARTPKIVGGSTITQQLAKNLFLSGERTLMRKGQEFVLTLLLESMLSKQRILEIYLNSVEWGEGVFGAEAAAQHYYQKSASRLTAYEAARLAVMLPRPRYYEKLPQSPYLHSRANTIVARMGEVSLP